MTLLVLSLKPEQILRLGPQKWSELFEEEAEAGSLGVLLGILGDLVLGGKPEEASIPCQLKAAADRCPAVGFGLLDQEYASMEMLHVRNKVGLAKADKSEQRAGQGLVFLKAEPQPTIRCCDGRER